MSFIVTTAMPVVLPVSIRVRHRPSRGPRLSRAEPVGPAALVPGVTARGLHRHVVTGGPRLAAYPTRWTLVERTREVTPPE